MKVRKQFKAALALHGLKIREICEQLGTTPGYLYKIIDYMENEPDRIPQSELGAAIVGKVNDVVNSLPSKVKEVA